MRLTFLGSCSGTEPMPGRMHTAYVIEHDGGIYWFDAGEGCSHTAHVSGIDLFAIRAVFVTHPHIDHTGGLANLIWTMEKLQGRYADGDSSLEGRTVPVFIPSLSVWEGALAVAGAPAERFDPPFTVDGRTYTDGTIYDDGGVRVIARHNTHLGEPEPGKPWQAYSFRVEAAGKVFVTSGDIGHVSELGDFLDGCDLFIMETGHHKVEDVCTYLRDTNVSVAKLGFFHHGRAVLEDAAAELSKAQRMLGPNVFIAEDGMSVDV